MFSVLEAAVLVLTWMDEETQVRGNAHYQFKKHVARFQSEVRTILREERISFDLVERRIIPLESLELHTEVVVPTLSLLGGSAE